MTEPHNTPEPEATPADSLELPENLEAAKKLRSENKMLRERLRSLESDHEAAVSRLEAMRHSEVQRVAAEHLVDSSDIWSAPNGLDDVTDEFGQVDPAKVAEAAKSLTAVKPHLGKDYNPAPAKPPTDRPIEGLRTGSPGQKPVEPSWANAIQGRAPSRIAGGG